MRFEDVTDYQHVLGMLVYVRLKKGGKEFNVTLSECHFLPGQPERQLTGYFTDDLNYDYLQFKIMRENPTTLSATVAIAVNEEKN